MELCAWCAADAWVPFARVLTLHLQYALYEATSRTPSPICKSLRLQDLRGNDPLERHCHAVWLLAGSAFSVSGFHRPAWVAASLLAATAKSWAASADSFCARLSASRRCCFWALISDGWLV